MRVLFIGNSYTHRNDLPGMLAGLAAAAEPPTRVQHERVIANGAPLRQHWNRGEALARIEEGGWDAVVLQEQSTLPVKNAARYHENVRLFVEPVGQHARRLVLYLAWARQAAPESQRVLDGAAREIARETGALVAPVGPAWERVLGAEGAPRLFEEDGSHPTPAGTYLAACVFFSTLLGASPEGLPTPDRCRLTPGQALLLQGEAARAAREWS